MSLRLSRVLNPSWSITTVNSSVPIISVNKVITNNINKSVCVMCFKYKVSFTTLRQFVLRIKQTSHVPYHAYSTWSRMTLCTNQRPTFVIPISRVSVQYSFQWVRNPYSIQFNGPAALPLSPQIIYQIFSIQYRYPGILIPPPSSFPISLFMCKCMQRK